MITRELQRNLPELSKGFPVVTITGPRQSGKTTLVKMAIRIMPILIWKIW